MNILPNKHKLRFVLQHRRYGYTPAEFEQAKKYLKPHTYCQYSIVISKCIEVLSRDCYPTGYKPFFDFDGYIVNSIAGKYLPIVDCDSEKDYEKAAQYLTDNKYRFYPIKSSGKNDDSYWIIVDFLGQHVNRRLVSNDPINFIKKVPGCDEKFIKYAEFFNKIVIRAFPKYALPYFPENYDFTNCSPEFRTYCKLLREHFNSPKITYILEESLPFLFQDS